MSADAAKSPGETYKVAFDFAALLEEGETLSGTPSVAVTLLAGTDANPAELLDGAAAIQGTRVRQRVRGGVDGCVYSLTATVQTSSSNTWQLPFRLPVRNAV